MTFAARTGTTFYRLRTAEETVIVVVALLAHGGPLQAIVAAFGVDERTVADWHARAGAQCQRVQAHLVEQPRALVQGHSRTRKTLVRVTTISCGATNDLTMTNQPL